MSEKPRALALLVAFLLGVVLAGAVAAYVGYNAGTALVIKNWVNEQAGDIDAKVEVLELLRSDETGAKDTAIARLEDGLNLDAVFLRPESDIGVAPETEIYVTRGLGRFRTYRRQHPFVCEKQLYCPDLERILTPAP